MSLENIMSFMLENNNYDDYGDQDNNNLKKMEDHHQQQQAQFHSPLHFTKISNEFFTIKDSMEKFPLPGNNEELQNASNMIELKPQVEEVGQGTKTTDLLMSMALSTEANKHKIKEMAQKAMDEVTRMFMEGEPLWQHDLDRGLEVLNMVEYERKFISSNKLDMTLEEIIKMIAVDTPLDLPNLDEIIPTNVNNNNNNEDDNSIMEDQRSKDVAHHCSREVGYVQMPAISIVEVFMDVRLWSFMFSEMLSKATVLGVISPGAPTTFDGALQMMTVEYHVPSPLVSTRQSCFARYCKELSTNTWAIVDISLDSLINNHPLINCKRRPSGCLIQGLLDGNTQVTWIEHTETESAKLHPLFNSLVSSGVILSAKQWVDTLARQCQHLHMLLQNSLHGLYNEIGPYRVEGLLRLAERMKREFHGAMSATEANGYKPMSIKGGEDILIKISNSSDDQSPVLMTVTKSSWLPFSTKKVFSFLSNIRNRTKWDVLALGHSSEELFHVHSNEGPEDIVSITKMVDEKGEIDTLSVQQKHESTTASYVIFSPIIYDSLVLLSNDGNTDGIAIIPSGFAILSSKDPRQEEASEEGSIVTLSFQLLDRSSTPKKITKKSIRKVFNLVNNTINSIRAALFEAPAVDYVNQDCVQGCMCLQRKIEETKQTQEAISNNIGGRSDQASEFSMMY